MDDLRRRNHYDVTDRIFVGNPKPVQEEVGRLLRDLDADLDLRPMAEAFDVFTRLYTGELTGYLGCETWYHDAQHSLDSALTLARLLDGHERTVAPRERVGSRRLLLGVIAALFHDAGYIRRVDDDAHHGAAFTQTHVRRSADFLADLLPRLGFTDEAPMAWQLLQFTGYELELDEIPVTDPLDRRLGYLLGSADLLAQMSDRCYLEKCRDCLYVEFEICGMAGYARPDAPAPIFPSPEALMRGTPGFIDETWKERLDGYFEGVHRYEEMHFGGRRPYIEAVQAHRPRLEHALAANDIHGALRRRAECINAGPLRAIVGLDADGAPIATQSWPPAPRYAA